VDLYSASSRRTSKALRYGQCVTRGSQFYLPPTHKPYLPLLPSRKASPPFGRYQLVLLGKQRHTGVRNLSRVSTPRARPRLEPTTSRSPRRHLLGWLPPLKATVIDRESQRPTRWIKAAIHICKEGQQAMNRDEGSYLLSHAYNRFLDTTDVRRIRIQKN